MMKLKYTFEFVDIDDEIICVPIGQDACNFHGILKVNQEGRRILELLMNGYDTSSIISQLVLEYDNDNNSIIKYVNDFVDKLQRLNVIDEQ